MKNWLSELDESGFCHDSLKALESQCSEYLAIENISSIDRIIAYVVRGVCNSVSEKLDDEVPTGKHNQIKEIVFEPLRESISSMDSQNAKIALGTLDRLIVASRQAKLIASGS